MKIWNNVIVGAGLSGLILGQRLQSSGQDVLILEKAKSVGGRMATRRDGDAAFDHGAQFSSSRFADLSNDHLWKPWINLNTGVKYSVDAGINKAAKNLAVGLEVYCNQKVVAMSHDEYVALTLESHERILAKKVFLTCPLPQSCELLKASQISYPQELDQITYAKALVGLFRLESDHMALTQFNYAEDKDRGIFSVSNQQSKSVSQNLAYTVVMNPKFSEQYFNFNEADILFFVENCFVSFLHHVLKVQDSDFKIIRSQLKKWKYSHPLSRFNSDYYAVGDNKIVLLGDGFTGGSLVNAVKSAQAVPI